MAPFVILATSIVLQFAAAGIAVALLRITGQRLAWGMVSAAMILMGVRRSITFYDIAVANLPVRFDMRTELVALAISALAAGGTALLVPYFSRVRREQAAQHESEAALAEAQRIAQVGSWEWNPRTNRVWWSDEHYRIFGYAPGEIEPTYQAYLDAVHPDDRETVRAQMAAAITAGRPYSLEHRIVLPDGSERIIHEQGGMVFDAAGSPIRMRGVVHDITARKRAEALTTRLGRIVENSVNEVYVFDSKTFRFLQVNRGARENLGYSEDELRTLTPLDLKPQFTRESFEELVKPLQDGSRESVTFESVHRRKDGSLYDIEVRLQLSRAESPPVFFAVVQDITERRRAAAEIRKREDMFRALIENALDMIALISAEGTIKFASPSCERVMGYRPADLIGRRPAEFVHPEDFSALAALLDRVIRTPGSAEQTVMRFRHADGSWHAIESIFRNLLDDPAVGAIVANARDVTERAAMEDQLRQAQRMEAVGQLTGGVAHDFNNLLAVILGNLELLEDRARNDPALLRLVIPAIRAAEQGALLTQRLLAFSRKQALRPRAVDLNDHLAELMDVLHRTLRETVTVTFVPGAGLWPCKVDPAQLDNAILNLAINARDAMPAGGTLTIETRNAWLDDEYAAAQAEIEPGCYVVLSVSDTGTGMPPEVLEHVFEPFFTTKEVGKGTGLGLSMVYGFVKQSGGHVTIYSEMGQGTTVRLYLPRAAPARAPLREGDVPASNLRARGETVLVVEDDANVRSLAVSVLGDLGYDVLEACRGRAALDLLVEHPRVNLLITDMILPGGMNGRELASEARRLCPGIKTLFMSGYSEKMVAGDGRLAEGEIMLQKPFRIAEFARKVREALERD